MAIATAPAKALIDERTQWLLRIRSVLYHRGLSAGRARRDLWPHGPRVPGQTGPSRRPPRTGHRRAWHDRRSRAPDRQDRALAAPVTRHQVGLPSADDQFGVGELIALTLLTELGDVTRMSSSRKAVRFAGIDIGVHRSDHTSRVGKLTRQGSSPLRWAL